MPDKPSWMLQSEWDNLIAKPAQEAERRRAEAAIVRIAEHLDQQAATANQETVSSQRAKVGSAQDRAIDEKDFATAMAEGIFLRVPADVAKKQLEERASYKPDDYHSADNATWSRINLQVLTSLFTSSKLADEYKAEQDKYIRRDEMDALGCYRLKAYIKNLAGAIESFPRDPSQVADIPDKLLKLAQLHAAGALTSEEFAQAKAKLLG